MGWGGHALLVEVLNRPRETYLEFTLPAKLTRGVKAKFYQSHEAFLRDYPHPGLQLGESVLSRVQRTQTLRVGYGIDIVPFAYRNKKGELVGYDVACAYDLARALNVRLIFAPVVYNDLEQDVRRGVMDIWMGGVYVMESRMMWGAFSNPYFQSPIALIVPSERVEAYSSMSRIRRDKQFAIAIMDNPIMRTLAHRLFPWAKQVIVPGYDQLTKTKGWSAALWTLEQGGVWAASHPGYSAVRPKNLGAVIVFAYMMPRNSTQLMQFVNHWLDMRKADGFLARQRAFWMEGAIAGGR